MYTTSLAVKNLPANAGDMDLNPGSRRSPEGGNGNPLQYSCLGKLQSTVSQRVGHDLATKQHGVYNAVVGTTEVFKSKMDP